MIAPPEAEQLELWSIAKRYFMESVKLIPFA